MNMPGTKIIEGANSETGVRPVKVIHRKIGQYQNIPIDGCWGMMNQNGSIQLELYLEKPPMPDTLNYPVVKSPEGDRVDVNFKETYASGENAEGNYVVIREVQAGLILSLAGAMQLHHVLSNFIKLARSQAEEIQAGFKAEVQQAELEKIRLRK